MKIRANLKVQLYANDVLVAESNDPELWQGVLQIAQKESRSQPQFLLPSDELCLPADADEGTVIVTTSELQGQDVSKGAGKVKSVEQALTTFANVIGVTPEEIIGACDPSLASPFLCIDAHYLAAFRKVQPSRGRGGVSDLILVATLTAQWFKHAALGDLGWEHVKQVLAPIEQNPKNIKRTFDACSWLKMAGNIVKLNPAEIIQADAVAKAFCGKQAIQEIK